MEEKYNLRTNDNNYNKDDKLKRKELAEKYVKFITSLDSHHVIALDSPWGTGKSTFINYMCEKLKVNNSVFVSYNAWENDYTKEPLISLMNDIFHQFKDKKYIGIDKMKSSMNKISFIAKKGGSAILKGGSKLFLGEKGTNDIEDALKEAAKLFIKDVSDDIFKDVEESKKSRQQFKEELKKYTKKILEEKNKDKLIILIDELDRCKPSFAIELLENIKHLFDIENIIFFIAVDNKQLAESIKSIYGNGFDANTYLHRFFDIELHLPKNNMNKYFIIQLDKKVYQDTYNKIKDINEFTADTIKAFNLSIRDIDRICNEIFLLSKLFHMEEPNIYLFLLILKYKNNTFYKYIKSKNKLLGIQDIDKYFEDHKNERDFFYNYFFKYCFNKRQSTNNYTKINEITVEAFRRIEETL
ncbi:hypothetical protein CRU98_02465 [Arcobacter sp. CECT 8986]|uniref:KAP family P-loop NTPase fold protein n=1 Tax=Arcobacter sp. CECT 8986 TaxID=2044507 RepID=UPI001009DF5D|nr:P-loop NTPase fold protein [Arcobacter sp. CECT 8986]RXK01326.1 hypothetical protein CRU98_02465 [Arcobacter sp. CECT 8986]